MQSNDSHMPEQGRIASNIPAGTTPTHDRPTFSDPLPGNTDPTEPNAPEQVIPLQPERERAADPEMRIDAIGAPQQNIQDWRRTDAGPG
jgi:hypothetical protein